MDLGNKGRICVEGNGRPTNSQKLPPMCMNAGSKSLAPGMTCPRSTACRQAPRNWGGGRGRRVPAATILITLTLRQHSFKRCCNISSKKRFEKSNPEHSYSEIRSNSFAGHIYRLRMQTFKNDSSPQFSAP